VGISEQKPPPIRTDLEIVPQYYRGELCYVAKDPVTLTYYRLGEVEYIVLKSFQQGMGVEQTQREVKRRIGAELSELEIFKFANQLRSSSLLKSKGMEDVRRLSEQRIRVKKHKTKQMLSNYLFITIPLWDPDRLLRKLLPYFRLLLNKLFLFFWVAVTGTALWIIVTHFKELVADAFSILSGWNLLILSGVIFSVKFIHEMGHALTCKHYGGEVHAIGPAFLVFQPCMFTDTSDAWLNPNKWERIAVTAAGIFSEIMLAAMAAIVWISSEPGFIKQVAFTTMVACSVNTILFNANPLLRFDGYYILSDLLEIPNLRVKTSQYLNYLFDRYMLGLKGDPPRMQPGDHHIYIIYGVARLFYRLILVFSIGLFLYSVFEPLGVFMWGTSLYGMILMPLWKKGTELTKQYKTGSVRARYLLVLGGAVVVVAALWLVPVDYTVSAPCVVTPAGLSIVRAPIMGKVERVLAQAGQRVRKGDALAEMEDELLHLRAQYVRELVKEADARLRGTLDTNPAAHEMLLRDKAKLTRELDQIDDLIERLVLRAPQDGVVVKVRNAEMKVPAGPHEFVLPDEDASLELSALEGRTVRAGTGIMGVATTNVFVFETFVQEHDLSYLSAGDKLECLLRSKPGRPFLTQVASMTPVDVKTIENVGITLADVGYIPVKPGPDGRAEPLVTLYVLRSRLEENKDRLPLGVTGKAKMTYGRGPAGNFYVGRIVRGIKLRLQQL